MNNKAFTLMELLTIIVVLSVIALITIPLINDTLQDSKRKISQNSAQQYKKAVDEYILQQQMKKKDIILNGTYNINSHGYLVKNRETHEIEFTGKKPENGKFIYANDELQTACITINGYKITFEQDEVVNTEIGICEIN